MQKSPSAVPLPSMAYGAMLMAVVTDQSFLQTKVIMNGTIAALKGFSNKLGIALANGILSAVLAMTGYIANAVGQEPQASLAFQLCCDDLERENGNVEKAEKMVQSCEENGYIPVSMKNDWKTIYGDGVTRKSVPDVEFEQETLDLAS